MCFLTDTAGDAEARRSEVIEAVAELFGSEARSPLDWREHDWGREEWTGGCVSPLAPGVLTRSGAALRAPVGRIHWAGTETATVWCGYLEGAVRAGRRAAGEVLG